MHYYELKLLLKSVQEDNDKDGLPALQPVTFRKPRGESPGPEPVDGEQEAKVEK